jgi:hypothetical protein
MSGTKFANGFKYYCPVLLEFVNECAPGTCLSRTCFVDAKPLVKTQEALISHLQARGRDPAMAWFALSGNDPLPGSACAASPDQIRTIMASYAKAGEPPERVAAKSGLPLTLVLNVFRFFGVPHKAPPKRRAPAS